jgi:nitroreductase
MPAEDARRAYAEPGSMEKVWSGLDHLDANLHRVPALVVPCITGRTDAAPVPEQAGTWGSVLPAVWSFMLAARMHGLGTCWTTANLPVEREVADLLGIPHAEVMQAALIPLAHTIGTDFRPASRVAVDEVLHWDRW